MSTQNESANRLSLPIRQFGDPVLRGQAQTVAPERIGSEEIRTLIDSMEASLSTAGGIGLAAPQVGVLSRLFIVRIPAMRRAGYGQVAETPLLVVINPRIVYESPDTRFAPEACLSIHTPDGRGIYEGVVERPERVVVQGYDRTGKPVELEGDSLLARVMQHEIDHLDGILFTDRIRQLRDLRIYYPVESADPVLQMNNFLRPEAGEPL